MRHRRSRASAITVAGSTPAMVPPTARAASTAPACFCANSVELAVRVVAPALNRTTAQQRADVVLADRDGLGDKPGARRPSHVVRRSRLDSQLQAAQRWVDVSHWPWG